MTCRVCAVAIALGVIGLLWVLVTVLAGKLGEKDRGINKEEEGT
ncbi:MAG: hypothetical protein PHH49_07280 [Candidatus Omnitrophica bacterium]|nr:hypothetical protein [Candidatus Omnitrophota bacterium]MDD5488736.1 hypothetical protein [Candidatus Omnitrophota bacterium]